MNIWLARHGQTDLNRKHLMQGRTDQLLNETGLAQAREMRRKLEAENPSLHFDAVFASPLQRAVVTGSILAAVDPQQIRLDDRLIEADFGKYERHKYYLLSPAMSAYWMMPERFPAPETVETVASMTGRASSFLQDLEQEGFREGWDNVLVACHGGILRSLCGYMEDRANGLLWRPKPHNCEVRVYSSLPGDVPGQVCHNRVKWYSLKG